DEGAGVRVALVVTVPLVLVLGEHLSQGRFHRDLAQREAVAGDGHLEDGVGGEGPVEGLDGPGVLVGSGAVPVDGVVNSGHGTTLRLPEAETSPFGRGVRGLPTHRALGPVSSLGARSWRVSTKRPRHGPVHATLSPFLRFERVYERA